jgi:hypothetical protein
MKFLNFFLFLWVIFAFLDPNPDSKIRIQSESGYGSTDLTESGSETLVQNRFQYLHKKGYIKTPNDRLTHLNVSSSSRKSFLFFSATIFLKSSSLLISTASSRLPSLRRLLRAPGEAERCRDTDLERSRLRTERDRDRLCRPRSSCWLSMMERLPLLPLWSTSRRRKGGGEGLRSLVGE